jgi:hypothetical protein
MFPGSINKYFFSAQYIGADSDKCFQEAELSQTYLKRKISLTFTDVPSEGIPVLAVCTP